jgi:hypothetical protein
LFINCFFSDTSITPVISVSYTKDPSDGQIFHPLLCPPAEHGCFLGLSCTFLDKSAIDAIVAMAFYWSDMALFVNNITAQIGQ